MIGHSDDPAGTAQVKRKSAGVQRAVENVQGVHLAANNNNAALHLQLVD